MCSGVGSWWSPGSGGSLDVLGGGFVVVAGLGQDLDVLGGRLVVVTWVEHSGLVPVDHLVMTTGLGQDLDVFRGGFVVVAGLGR